MPRLLRNVVSKENQLSKVSLAPRLAPFLGVLTDRTLQITAYSASRGLSFRSLPVDGQNVVAARFRSAGNVLQARNRDGKIEHLLLQDIADSEFGSLRLGVISLSLDDARELDELGLLSDTAHRLRVALRQD